MMRKEKQNIGARIPQELLDELNALVSSSGKTKSDIINEIIAKYFGQTKIATIDRITTIENKLAQNNQTFDIAPLNQRLDKLEDILQAILQALGDIKPEIKIVENFGRRFPTVNGMEDHPNRIARKIQIQVPRTR
jgi:hypothetical protein